MSLRTLAVFGGFALVAATLAANVAGKERLLAHGEPVLLELAPVDPRSLMQGDFMVLDYAVSRAVQQSLDAPRADGSAAADTASSADGHLVLRLDEHGVGTFARIAEPPERLAPGETLLRYRLRNGRVRLGAESFFFQEGHAERYEEARYGELRVAPDGESLLVGLRDAERRPLGAAPPAQP